MRLAVLTVSPMTVYSMRLAAPMFPAKTGPECSPIPKRISGRPRSFQPLFMAESVSRISSAAAKASLACVALGIGAPNKTIIASPMYLFITPPWRATHFSRPVKYSFKSATIFSGAIFSDSVVKPRMSQNMTVTSSVSPPKATLFVKR